MESKYMNDLKDIFADPWLKKAGKTKSLPDDAILACAYDLHIGPEIMKKPHSSAEPKRPMSCG